MSDNAAKPQARRLIFLFGFVVPFIGLYGYPYWRPLLWFFIANLWLPPFLLFAPCLIGIIAYNWNSPRLDSYTGRFIAGFFIGYLLAYSPLLFLFFGPGDFHD